MVASGSPPQVVVVGCGVIGMTTALALRSAGLRVEIWTRDDPLRTTSSVAGAIWYPFLAEPRERVRRWSAVTFARLQALAAQDGTGVAMCEVVEVFDDPAPDLWWRDAVPELRWLGPDEMPGRHAAAVCATVPVCDAPRHLAWLLAELRRRDVPVVRRAITSFDQPHRRAATVVNCAGLGARELCTDRELRAVRGQVLRVEGAPVARAWIDDTTARPRYVIPRAADVVVGGTAQDGDERLAVDDADSERILRDAVAAFPELARGHVREARVGLRPYRSTVRLEEERRTDGRRLLHNYGHGGSGYTVAWGCAEEVAALVRG
ncbi:MAG: FAD-binding oxidoreductase [Planctomycetes bacterium]|nr:FAD-binding oxidoreductase [Planctomycetota bacterium]